MTAIKFCGITRPGDAGLAQELGAAYAGVVFAASARQVTTRHAREIFLAAPGIRHVGVFRRAGVQDILDEAAAAGLHVIQLHGDFRPAEIASLRDGFGGEIWGVLPVDSRVPAVPRGAQKIIDAVDAVLLDTSVAGNSGGSGIAFEWGALKPFAAEIEGQVDLIVAGGLNPENVGAMIRALSPSVADVSSGVEAAPGIKDPHLMAAFAQAVAAASIV